MSSSRLSAREEAAWRGFNEMRALLVSRVSKELAADSGLTEADYSVLLAVVESPGRSIGSRDLLRRLRWEPSRLSHQLSRMESRGSIARAPSREDARSFEVSITEAGLDAIRRATPEHFRTVRRWFVDALDADQLDAMADIARAVTAHFAALDAAGADPASRCAEGLPPEQS